MVDQNRSAFGNDDPNRGPIDRAENALDGRDDPNRGPVDRLANAATGGTGGLAAATGSGSADEQRRESEQGNDRSAFDFDDSKPRDDAAIAVGDTLAATVGGSAVASEAEGREDQRTGRDVVSAIFDSNEEAQRAVEELRQIGVRDSDLSLIAQSGRTMTTREGGGEVTDEEHTNILRGIIGGGALGAGLGVAALAIPGVGPLAALGAIAAGAVPEAMAIGGALGAAAGTFNEALKKHGVSDEDSAYYGERLKSGGVLVTAHVDGSERERAQEVLYRQGGHSSSRARAGAGS